MSLRIFVLASLIAIGCASSSPHLRAARARNSQDNVGCKIFPADDVWNTKIDKLPVDASSESYIASIGAGQRLHPDFGAKVWRGAPIGFPFVVVNGNQAKVPILFDNAGESDGAGYPIPPDAPLEADGAGDSHLLVIDKNSCRLYELYAAARQGSSWKAGSGAIYDLRSSALRPAGWTSADAAGLPIFPGLVRYGEVAAGQVQHALRFTAPHTRNEYIWPARHYASHLTGRQYPPMGQRFRLKASVDITHFSRDAQVIMQALKTYGMFLADNGASWFLSGTSDSRWSDRTTHDLKSLHGSDFEAIDEFSLRARNNSGRVRPQQK